MKNSHERLMSYALNLAKKNLGQTAPNPVVGCVIVKDGEIISTGVTAKNGRPHAEKIAIDKALAKKINLSSAEIYVTLEPCAHYGHTAPCVDEIIKQSFKKVVIATQDPDERVNGKGIEKLREAKIDVLCGVLEKEAREINRGFFKAKKTGLPFVTAKLGVSLDGKIAAQNFSSKWITNETARQFAHLLRAQNEGILIGANTLRKDDPSLDCRLSGLEECSPKIIIAGKNNIPTTAKIFQNNDVLIFDGSIAEILKKICASGVNSVLVEGGQKIITQLLQENLIDELVLIRSKKIIGNEGISAIGNLNLSDISQALEIFSCLETRELSGDLAEIYKR